MNHDHEIQGERGQQRGATLSPGHACPGQVMRDEHPELDLDASTDELEYAPDLQDAIDLASDQDRSTWLRSDGKRVAAIVPPEVLGRYDQLMEAVTRMRPIPQMTPELEARYQAWLEEQPDD